MKMLLTGMDGQLGFELRRALAPLGEVVAVGRNDCDLADDGALRALVRRHAPDAIVNPAAYTAVDRAESDEAAAFAVNAAAPRILGEEGARLGAPVVHYSTDYVFDGAKAGAYAEDDAPAPCNAYGRTKLRGELDLAGANPRHLILRTGWIVGAQGANFAKTMLRLAATRDRLGVVADQHGAPTPAALLADLTALLLRQYRREGADRFPCGTYHVAAAGETTWYDYARFVVAEAHAAGKPLRVTPDAIDALRTDQFPTPARRPANSRLDTRRFCATFGLHLPDWRDGVRHVLQQIFRDTPC